MSDPLLKIANHHAAACGDPPSVDGNAQNCYVGYFENPYGEQRIFTMNRQTGKAALRGGDVGWNTEIDVTNGTASDLILGQEEQLWLQANWSSARKQVARNLVPWSTRRRLCFSLYKQINSGFGNVSITRGPKTDVHLKFRVQERLSALCHHKTNNSHSPAASYGSSSLIR